MLMTVSICTSSSNLANAIAAEYKLDFIEVLTGFILKELFGFAATNQDLALIGQFSENQYNGVNCGIMDQFAIAMGKKENAIFLDTADLSYEYAPIVLENAKIVITSSNKLRTYTSARYYTDAQILKTITGGKL